MIFRSKLIENLKFALYSVSITYAQNDADKFNVNSKQVNHLHPNDYLNKKIGKAVKEITNFVSNYRDLNKIPGLVIGISYKGNPVWIQGFGYSNVELSAKCDKDTVMRIASISKSITMLLVAKLVEENKLDLDKSIYHYLDKQSFPFKYFDGEKVDITLGQLVSHISGIRNYKTIQIDNKDTNEFHLNKKFESVTDSLSIFKDDDLISKPGTNFLYSSLTWTLISAVVESVLPETTNFGKKLINDICRKDLGMFSTYLDENAEIILNRSAHYQHQNGKLINAQYVDNSYKWAGGGLLSTVPDLLKFGNVMLYSYKGGKDGVKGYLKSSTVEQLWKPVPISYIMTQTEYEPWAKYGMGWILLRECVPRCVNCFVPPFQNIIFHSGHSVGGGSCLIILPEEEIVIATVINVEEPMLTFPLVIKVAQMFCSRINPVYGKFD